MTLKGVGCIMMVVQARGSLSEGRPPTAGCLRGTHTHTHTTQTSFSWLARVPEVGRDIIAHFDEKSQHLFHQKIFSFFA